MAKKEESTIVQGFKLAFGFVLFDLMMGLIFILSLVIFIVCIIKLMNIRKCKSVEANNGNNDNNGNNGNESGEGFKSNVSSNETKKSTGMQCKETDELSSEEKAQYYTVMIFAILSGLVLLMFIIYFLPSIMLALLNAFLN